MELKLYDTLTREKRVFNPIDPARVRMYVCGPTVYDFAHIGNARPVIVFDVLYRLLRHLYGPEHVAYVRNITDVDDKINARAAERGISIRQLTEETYNNFKSDVAALGCLPPTVEPRATDYVSNPGAPVDMIRLIERLIKNGNAYAAEGHVLFDVPSMPDYGQLSKRPLDEMIAGSRVEVAPYKRDPQDFVLWKPSPPDLPGWDSPWGRGRPGWHIECSAMSAALLGETFDIHGGGIDLVFPHHENEIAQSRCAFHTGVMANYWMHNGFLQVEGEKMSKSLGNFVTIHELLKDWPGEVVRLNMLKTHYRQPIDWTEKGLLESKSELESWRAAYGNITIQTLANLEAAKASEFFEAICDDLNTPAAIGVMHGYAKHASKNEVDRASLLRCLDFLSVDRSVSDFRLRFNNIINDVDQFFRSNRETTEKIAALYANSFANIVNSETFSSLVQAIAEVTQKFSDIGQQIHAALAPMLQQLGVIAENIRKAADRYGGWDAVWELLKYYNKDREFSWDLVEFAKDKDMNEKIESRLKARMEKNFRESDRIRDELAAMGVVLKDSKEGTTWEIAR